MTEEYSTVRLGVQTVQGDLWEVTHCTTYEIPALLPLFIMQTLILVGLVLDDFRLYAKTESSAISPEKPPLPVCPSLSFLNSVEGVSEDLIGMTILQFE
jgi:hypothetical protein